MDIFRGIDLNDSFVLSWMSSGRELVFSLEASIWPESEHYQEPRQNEYTCYRPASLRISGVDSINGLKSMDECHGFLDANNEVDYGNIDDLCRTSSGFELHGEFGVVIVAGGTLEFEIHT